MSLLFVTDFHHGPLIESRHGSDVSIFGNFASAMQRALIDYAHKNNITTIVDGGDQSSSSKNSAKTLENAARPRQLRATFAGTYACVLGNHDPSFQATSYGFSPQSHTVTQSSLAHTHVIIAQPDITTTEKGKKYRYRYNADDIKTCVHDCNDPNLIIAGHWAFDRKNRDIRKRTGGTPYEYVDDCDPINDALKKQSSKEQRTIMTLHGHEHYFSINERLGYTAVVMPSIVQSDIDFPHRPCGLFAVITDKKRGGLTIEYRKLTIGHKPKLPIAPDYVVTKNIPLAYMLRYCRPC